MMTTISISLGSVTDVLEKLIKSTRSGIFSRASKVARSGRSLCVRLYVCVHTLVMNALRDVTTITGDSVFSGIVICLETQNVSC